MKTQYCAVRVGYAAVLLISAILAGCANENTIPPEPTGTQYVGTDIVVPGRPNKATMYDLDRLIVQTMTKLNNCTEFEEAYNTVQKVVNPTKLIYSEYFSELSGNKVYFKPSCLKLICSFKEFNLEIICC